MHPFVVMGAGQELTDACMYSMSKGPRRRSWISAAQSIMESLMPIASFGNSVGASGSKEGNGHACIDSVASSLETESRIDAAS